MSEVTKRFLHFYKDGSYLSRGQLLYKPDDADIRAPINQLSADIPLAGINEKTMHELLKKKLSGRKNRTRHMLSSNP